MTVVSSFAVVALAYTVSAVVVGSTYRVLSHPEVLQDVEWTVPLDLTILETVFPIMIFAFQCHTNVRTPNQDPNQASPRGDPLQNRAKSPRFRAISHDVALI